MLVQIAHFFLSFTQELVIIPLIIIGYIWLDQKVFFHAICLILISILVNYALKITFKVPLSTTLNKEGFAFPSGHMQSSMVLYGWLILKTYNRLCKIFMGILLLGVGLSLVYCGYHNYFDVLGAIFFGSLLIFLYVFLTKIDTNRKTLPLVLLSLSTLLMLYIASIHLIIAHLWMAYYALIGILFSEYFFAKKDIKINIQTKILATIFCFIAVFITKKIFTFISFPVFFTQLQWVIIGFCIPFSIYICIYPKLKK